MNEENREVVINIVGQNVALGPVIRDLLPLYTRWMNDFAVVTTLGVVPSPVTLERETEWFNSSTSNNQERQFTIYVRENMLPIGNAALKDIDFRLQRAEFGILIGEKECWNKGYGTEVANLLLDYGFNAMGLHSIYLAVLSNNPGAIRAYEKAGFKVAGRLREAIRVGQEFHDMIYMDCLASEFKNP
ncbi:MAG TPA: GNAT family protein [Chloroflexia bacterium]|nr:GNAT family protein [Chloroflexia bacterium]